MACFSGALPINQNHKKGPDTTNCCVAAPCRQWVHGSSMSRTYVSRDGSSLLRFKTHGSRVTTHSGSEDGGSPVQQHHSRRTPVTGVDLSVMHERNLAGGSVTGTSGAPVAFSSALTSTQSVGGRTVQGGVTAGGGARSMAVSFAEKYGVHGGSVEDGAATRSRSGTSVRSDGSAAPMMVTDVFSGTSPLGRKTKSAYSLLDAATSKSRSTDGPGDRSSGLPRVREANGSVVEKAPLLTTATSGSTSSGGAVVTNAAGGARPKSGVQSPMGSAGPTSPSRVTVVNVRGRAVAPADVDATEDGDNTAGGNGAAAAKPTGRARCGKVWEREGNSPVTKRQS